MLDVEPVGEIEALPQNTQARRDVDVISYREERLIKPSTKPSGNASNVGIKENLITPLCRMIHRQSTNGGGL